MVAVQTQIKWDISDQKDKKRGELQAYNETLPIMANLNMFLFQIPKSTNSQTFSLNSWTTDPEKNVYVVWREEME